MARMSQSDEQPAPAAPKTRFRPNAVPNAKPPKWLVEWRKTRHDRINRREPVKTPPQTYVKPASPAANAMDWLLPVHKSRNRAFLALLGGRVKTFGAVVHWISGYRPFPSWAATMIADAIEARCQAGMELARELRGHAEAEERRRLANPKAPPWHWSRHVK